MGFLTQIEEMLKSIDFTPASLDIPLIKETLSDQDISLLFQKAILSGEYIEDKDINSISNIESQLVNLSYLLQSENEIRATIDNIREQFFVPFKALSNDSARNLVLLGKGKEGITIDTKRFQFYRLKIEIYKAFKEGERAIISNGLNDALFQINLLLAYIDEYIECNKAFMYELSSIRDFLTKIKFSGPQDEITELLLEKAEYLEFKIKFRNALPQGDFTEISKEFSTISSGTNSYKELIKRTEHHYKKFNSPPIDDLLEECINEAKEKNFRLEAFHHLNRFIKREVKENVALERKKIEYYKSVIDEHVEMIEGKIRANSIIGNVPLFDDISAESIAYLLKNTALFCKLRIIERNDFKGIIDPMRDYVARGEGNSYIVSEYLDRHRPKSKRKVILRDYYCYLIFLEFLNKLINFLKLDHRQLTSVYEKIDSSREREVCHGRVNAIIKDIAAVYKDALDEINLSFDILATHRARQVYLTLSDCKVPYTWDDTTKGSLFMHSSYTLPNNKGKIKLRIDSLSILNPNQINSLKLAFEIADTQIEISNRTDQFEAKVTAIETDINIKIGDNNKTLKDSVTSTESNLVLKLKENEFKVVQIVAMFVSIATFVLINVKIFDGKSGLESFAIIIGLSACFYLFNLFFHFIVMDQYRNPSKDSNETNSEGAITAAHESRKHKIRFLAVPIFLALVSLGILIFQDHFFAAPKINAMSDRADRDSIRLNMINARLNELEQ